MPSIPEFAQAVQALPGVAQMQQPTYYLHDIPLTPDQLAYLNDSPDHHIEDYAPGWSAHSWDAPRFEPTPEALAECAGFDRGYDLDYSAQPPGDLSTYLALRWIAGRDSGIAHRIDDDDRDSSNSRLNELSDRIIERKMDSCEEARALGAIEYRKGGGE